MNTLTTDQQNGNVGRRSTRSALAELPTRPETMVVVENVQIAAPGQTNGRLWDISVNLPPSYISPSPSPDELVIQQRGRRKIPVTWSPDINYRERDMDRRDCTPVKPSPKKNTIILRSTPRKRLLLNDPKELLPTPEKSKKGSPNFKKNRIEKSSQAGPLHLALKGLSQDQLIDIIQKVIEKNPDLESEISASLPIPDLRPFEEKLNYLKRNIFKSLPNSRLTSKTDSPAYSRAATHVLAFKKCVVDQGKQLVESQHWQSVMDYVFLAWSYVRSTPLWDNPPHNAARKQCFKTLVSQCIAALKKGTWSQEELHDIEEKLETCKADSEDVLPCLKQLNSLKKKQL